MVLSRKVNSNLLNPLFFCPCAAFPQFIDLPFIRLTFCEAERRENHSPRREKKNQGNFSGVFIDIFRMVLYSEKAKPIIDQITITRKHISNMQSIKKYTLKRILLSPVKNTPSSNSGP